MIEFIVSKFNEIMKQAIDQYGVNPAIFLVIYLASVPFFYYSLFRMMRALAKKHGKEVLVWGMVLLCATIAPCIYILLFGRNLPWWIYVIIALLIGEGIFSLVRKQRKARGDRVSGGKKKMYKTLYIMFFIFLKKKRWE